MIGLGRRIGITFMIPGILGSLSSMAYWVLKDCILGVYGITGFAYYGTEQSYEKCIDF
jgi:hypothetical protein